MAILLNLVKSIYIHLRRARDCLRSCVAAFVEFLRGCRGGRPSDSFSSLWAAFALTIHINALYNEIIHRKEEHAS